MKKITKNQNQAAISAMMLLAAIMLLQLTVSGQFSSVQNGLWNNPQTWSTNPNATARPDSSSTVAINHVVSPGGLYGAGNYCYDLTINPSGILSTGTTDLVFIKNNLIVYGQIKPLATLHITVKGNLINHNMIHADGEGHIIFNLYGNIVNYGSVKNITNTYFKGYNYPHEHRIRSFNDSTIRLGHAWVNDSLGTIHIDSIAYLGGIMDLNRSKLKLTVWPYNWTTKLVLDNAELGRGTIEGNDQIITSKAETFGRLGIFGTYPSQNTKFITVNFEGDFFTHGNPQESQNTDLVVLENCSLTGYLSDYWTPGYYDSPKAIHINGLFTNNGTIRDTETPIDNVHGMHIKQNNGSTLINNGTISCRSVNFRGNCSIQTASPLAIKDLMAYDENTSVNIVNPEFFLGGSSSLGNVNFNGGTLHMPPNGYLHLDNAGHSMMTQKINIAANNSTIVMPWTRNDQVSIHNPRIKTLGVQEYIWNEEIIINGTAEILPDGILVNNYNWMGKVTFNGMIKNFGEIRNSAVGALYLNIKDNLLFDGITWSNGKTTINGSSQQSIQLLNNKSITGLVEFDAMLEGTNYQWYKDGNPVTNGTNRLLSFSNGLNSSHFGVYHCVVNGNQSRTITISGESATQITMLEEGFDNNWLPAGWETIINNTANTWLQGNNTSNNFNSIDPSSLYSAMCPWVAQNQDEWLITPAFSLGQGNAFVKFWAGYSTNWLNYATLKLHISIDNAKSWTQLWQAENDGQPWGWRESTIDLTSYGNQQNLKLAWQYVGNDGDLAGIDGVQLVGYTFPTTLEETIESKGIVLGQNYPNPFNEETSVAIELNKTEIVQLDLFDLTGHHIALLTVQELAAGRHILKINVQKLNLKSGVYFYRLSAKNHQKQYRMIVF
jgi:hypothetical protein